MVVQEDVRIEDVRIKNIVSWYESQKNNYEKFARLVLDKINAALKERGILTASTCCRAKSIKSFSDKCRKTIYDNDKKEFIPKYSNPRNQIMDCAGVRIVAYLQSDIQLIQRVIERMFLIDEENSQNKIELLDDDIVGYLSIHYIVSLKDISYNEEIFKDFRCEIQVRTILQDAWAQIFHDRQYKNSSLEKIIPAYLNRKTNLIAGSLELIDQQINDLIKQYDSLTSSINNVEYQKLLDESIDFQSLIEYLGVKFNGKARRFFDSSYCIDMLNRYGVHTIREIDHIISPGFVNAIQDFPRQLTIDNLIIYILLIYNQDKYFEVSGEKCIKEIKKDSFDLLNTFIDVEDLCLKHNVKFDFVRG